MKKSTTLILFYSGVVVIAAAIISISFFLRSKLPQPDLTKVVNAGKQEVDSWFQLEKDLQGVNQLGEEVALSDLKGKVWLAAEFFAVCPKCAVRNGSELRMIYDAFKDHPDFHIVCISIDPENDDVAKLKDYASALSADASAWWFINSGDIEKTHAFLEDEMKFFGVRERRDPNDIEVNGRFAHDLGLILVDRDMRVLGKWPLADARSDAARARDPKLYERLKKELFAKVRSELDKTSTEP